MLFHGPTLFDCAWNGIKCIKKVHKKCIKSAKFASKFPSCYKRACACANQILAKRTRACDVRAAENQVCECACVRGKKSSQLTDWIKHLSYNLTNWHFKAIRRKIKIKVEKIGKFRNILVLVWHLNCITYLLFQEFLHVDILEFES